MQKQQRSTRTKYMKAWRVANRGHIQAYQESYRASNPTYGKAWRAAHPAFREKWSTKHPLHATWKGMMQRCYSPKSNRYLYYGAKGITVCEHWQDFTTFERDMSPKPRGTTLGRYLDTGNYSCHRCGGNAVFMTWEEQGIEKQKKFALLQKAA